MVSSDLENLEMSWNMRIGPKSHAKVRKFLEIIENQRFLNIEMQTTFIVFQAVRNAKILTKSSETGIIGLKRPGKCQGIFGGHGD